MAGAAVPEGPPPDREDPGPGGTGAMDFKAMSGRN